jgi:TrmH family RNA methyltransferase
MKNFGLSDWAWVDPYAKDSPEARKLAVDAEELLERASVASSLPNAVERCHWVVGTSSRRLSGKRLLTPHEWATEAVERASAGEQVALVLGNERSGLSNEDLEPCHALSTIPTGDEQPSVNLAQSLLLYGYEYHQAVRARTPAPRGAAPTAATDGELRGLEEALGAALLESGFLRNLERHAVRDLVEPLLRARLTRKEARLWNAALRSFTKAR